MMTLEGIQFVTDATGKRKAVMLDLERYGELWEDIYDILLARERENEPRESLPAESLPAESASSDAVEHVGQRSTGRDAHLRMRTP